MKEEQPLISIIVPVYNVEKYLRECLDSIIEQDYDNYELILINDGSTDSSQKIMEEYAAKNDKIIAHNRKNKGVLYTRVEGTKMAKGKYIMFVDSDDWIERDTLKIFVEELRKDDYDIVKAKLSKEGGEKVDNFIQEEVIYKEQINDKIYKKLMTTDIFNTVCGQIIKKDIISLEEIDTDISNGDDMVFNIAVFKNINKMKLINRYVYKYRQNNTSITHNVSKEKLISNIDDVFKVYRKLANEMIKYGDADDVKLTYIRYLRKSNYGLYRIIRNYNIDSSVEIKIQEVLENDLTKEATQKLKISDIIFTKEFLFMWMILKGKKRPYIILLKLLAKIKK